MRRGDDPNWRHLFAVLRKFPLTDEEHRSFIGMVIGREIHSRKDLTPGEVRRAVAGYEGYLLMSSMMRDLRGSGRRLAEPEPEAVDPLEVECETCHADVGERCNEAIYAAPLPDDSDYHESRMLDAGRAAIRGDI